MIDRNRFRNALGRFVTGVTIVTARDREGRPVGLTANSFNSVSLDPPMVLWSLSLDSNNLPAFREASGWAVHILGAGQKEMSNRFATRGADKFDGLEVVDGPEGAPLIEGCAARFGCRASFEYEGGDHAIFVGEVIDFHEEPIDPLIYHDGRYGRVLPDSEAGGARDGEFAHDFTGQLLARADQVTNADLRRECQRRGIDETGYVLLTILGADDGIARGELIGQSAVEDVAATLDKLRAIDLAVDDGATVRLTTRGRAAVAELTAVASSAELHLEKLLSDRELALLRDLLARLASEDRTR